MSLWRAIRETWRRKQRARRFRPSDVASTLAYDVAACACGREQAIPVHVEDAINEAFLTRIGWTREAPPLDAELAPSPRAWRCPFCGAGKLSRPAAPAT